MGRSCNALAAVLVVVCLRPLVVPHVLRVELDPVHQWNKYIAQLYLVELDLCELG